MTKLPRSERIERFDASGLEIGHVARHDSEAVFKRRCSNHQISAVVAKCGAQPTPASGNLQIKREDSFAIKTEHAVEPGCERRSEVSVSGALPDDSAFNLADRYHADEKITRSLPVDP